MVAGYPGNGGGAPTSWSGGYPVVWVRVCLQWPYSGVYSGDYSGRTVGLQWGYSGITRLWAKQQGLRSLTKSVFLD